MSIFNRIAGVQEPKIAVWPIMMDFTMVLDGEITLEQLVEAHQLDEDEQVEVGEYLTAIGALVQAETQVRVGVGFPLESAVRDARVSVDAVLRYGLLKCEQGKITEAAFRASLGL